MKKMLNEDNQIHNFISSTGSGTVISYGSGSDFLRGGPLLKYALRSQFCDCVPYRISQENSLKSFLTHSLFNKLRFRSGSNSQKVTVPTVPVPQHCLKKSSCNHIMDSTVLQLATDYFINGHAGETIIYIIQKKIKSRSP